jgi:anti-sigma factor RsiW
MTCHEAEPLLHARLDNELDMAGSQSIDLHLAECQACNARYSSLQSLHEEIAAADLAYAPDARLERKLARRFLRADKPRFHPQSWFNAPVMATVAIAALLLIAIPMLRVGGATDAIAAEILDDHLRSLQPMHSVDVPSTDRHTVKPWFQGKTNFSPPVPDLSQDDFVLIGGRLEVIHQQPAAAIVYRRRQHIVTLYVSPVTAADSKPQLRDLGGYHLLHWSQNNMSYWAVSDVNPDDLRKFADLVRER